MGTVYLLHFDQPYRHARHYLGYTDAEDAAARVRKHAKGQGARLLAVLVAAGIGFRLVRTWLDVDRNFERELKKKRRSPFLCPLCRPDELGRRAEQQRAARRTGRRKAG